MPAHDRDPTRDKRTWADRDQFMTVIFQHMSYSVTSAGVFVVGALAYRREHVGDQTLQWSGAFIMAMGALLAGLNIVWTWHRVNAIYRGNWLGIAFTLLQTFFVFRVFQLAIITRF